MNSIDKKYGNAVLVAVMVMMFLFFTVQTLFNTKGEPREAIVAVSMLNSGNWILPQSFGADIPYKPPFLAWCIAAFSWVFGGSVTEFTSRLPSLLAAVIMIVATNRFFRNHTGSQLEGATTAWVTISSLEVFRAATACRVDMVLTMFIVCATYSLYNFFENRCRGGLPWLAILLMSGAALTKGPVGIGLPCLAIGIFRLLRGDRFWPLFGRLSASGVLACLLPAVWYYAAYQRGGDAFLQLALEENFGRLTGTMSYESHENPVYYNFMTLIAGMTPYSLLALMALFAVKWRSAGAALRRRWNLRESIKPVTLFAIVAALTILVFYSIPKSKRSVYLLPMYPFMAYFVVLLIKWLNSHSRRILVIFTRIMAVLAIAVPLAYVVLLTGCLDSVKAVGRLGFGQSAGMSAVGVLLALISVFIGVGSWRGASPRSHGKKPRLFSGTFGDASMSIFAIYVMLNIAVLPTLLSAKSDRYLADEVATVVPDGENVYGYVSADMLRFFTVNFYLNDRMRIFEREEPRKGILLVGEHDFDELQSRYGARYRFKPLYHATLKSCDVKQPAIIVEFKRK